MPVQGPLRVPVAIVVLVPLFSIRNNSVQSDFTIRITCFNHINVAFIIECNTAGKIKFGTYRFYFILGRKRYVGSNNFSWRNGTDLTATPGSSHVIATCKQASNDEEARRKIKLFHKACYANHTIKKSYQIFLIRVQAIKQ